jgi:hypothetical protein
MSTICILAVWDSLDGLEYFAYCVCFASQIEMNIYTNHLVV